MIYDYSMSQDSHPILLTFGRTTQLAFPLILILGREPNTAKKTTNQIGSYDFREYPRCGFWNTSYGMVARLLNIPTRELKRWCVEKESSPIIYADAFPTGIENAVVNKWNIRNNLSRESAIGHIESIFSYQQILSRVALVILSGLESTSFRAFVQKIEAESLVRKIPCIQMPFFYGTNTQKIQNALDKDARDKIIEVMSRFKKNLKTRGE